MTLCPEQAKAAAKAEKQAAREAKKAAKVAGQPDKAEKAAVRLNSTLVFVMLLVTVATPEPNLVRTLHALQCHCNKKVRQRRLIKRIITFS